MSAGDGCGRPKSAMTSSVGSSTLLHPTTHCDDEVIHR